MTNVTMYFQNGKMKTIPIKDINTITNNGDDGLCVMKNDGGCYYPKLVDFMQL